MKLQSIKESIQIGAVVLAIFGAVFGIIYLHWSAYHQRFPDAAFWTFLIQ